MLVVFNFTSLTLNLYVSATQPGVSNPKVPVKKAKDHGFKTAPDGRLIIADDNERDSDTEKKKKKKTPFPHSDSEDDYGKRFSFI